jgi:U4/U6.U5 tri-snRNP-associated protein 1
LKEKLQNAKDKRLSRQKLVGPTLADLEGEKEGELLTASSWVQRSRQKEIENKEQAKQLKEKAEREEEKRKKEQLSNYESKDLRGLSVKHGGEEFEIGEEMILTLADSSILSHGDDGRLLGVNSEGDVLENVNLAEKDRRLDREKLIKRSHQPVYAGYDDAEFAEGAVVGVKPSILPQYDKEVKAGPKLILSDEGVAISAKGHEEMSEGPMTARLEQSLHVDTTKEMSDYLTPTEYATFNKPKKEKKKRKIRKKESGGLIEELEASLEGQVEESGGGEGGIGSDRGKRGDGKSQLQMMRIEESERRQAYDLVVKAADAEVKAVVARATIPITRDVDVDDDAEIAESLARARRIALQQQRKNTAVATMDMAESKEDIGYEIAQKVRQTAEKFQRHEDQRATGCVPGLDDPDALDAEGRKRDGTLVFTSTTEFTTRLQARLQEKARSHAEAAMKDMNVSGSESEEEPEEGGAVRVAKKRKPKSTKPTKAPKSGWVDLGNGDMEVVNEWEESKGGSEEVRVEQEGEDEEEEDQAEEEEEETDEQMAFLHRQPLVAQGMAATLQLLKGSGDLKNKQELAGRAKDSRDIDPSDHDFGVKIEYRDKMGRKLTQKEAFRQLSYRFHGFGPGTKKREKKMRVSRFSQLDVTSTLMELTMCRKCKCPNKCPLLVLVLLWIKAR